MIKGMLSIMLKFISPKRREGITDNVLKAMRARGFDVYIYRNGKDIFINSNDWNEDKENRLYEEYGLCTFREQTGDCNLVIYDPEFFEVYDDVWLGDKILVYCGSNTGEVEFPTNCSSMKAMFQNLDRCEVDFSMCDLSNISCITNAFEMSNVNKIFFGKQNFYKLTMFEGAFNNCINLETVDFRGVQLPNVISISQCFLKCINLKNVNIGNVSIPKLGAIDECFEDCSELRSIECPNWDCTITSAYSAFDSCYSLQNVSMPNVVFDGDRFFNKMFRNSTNFISFDFKDFILKDFNNDPTRENANESMFRGCTKLRDKSGCILANEVLDYFKTRNNYSEELRNLESFN